MDAHKNARGDWKQKRSGAGLDQADFQGKDPFVDTPWAGDNVFGRPDRLSPPSAIFGRTPIRALRPMSKQYQ